LLNRTSATTDGIVKRKPMIHVQRRRRLSLFSKLKFRLRIMQLTRVRKIDGSVGMRAIADLLFEDDSSFIDGFNSLDFFVWPLDRMVEFKATPYPNFAIYSAFEEPYAHAFKMVTHFHRLPAKARAHALYAWLAFAKQYSYFPFWSPLTFETSPSRGGLRIQKVAQMRPTDWDELKPRFSDLYLDKIHSLVLVPESRYDDVFLDLNDYIQRNTARAPQLYRATTAGRGGGGGARKVLEWEKQSTDRVASQYRTKTKSIRPLVPDTPKKSSAQTPLKLVGLNFDPATQNVISRQTHNLTAADDGDDDLATPPNFDPFNLTKPHTIVLKSFGQKLLKPFGPELPTPPESRLPVAENRSSSQQDLDDLLYGLE